MPSAQRTNHNEPSIAAYLLERAVQAHAHPCAPTCSTRTLRHVHRAAGAPQLAYTICAHAQGKNPKRQRSTLHNVAPANRGAQRLTPSDCIEAHQANGKMRPQVAMVHHKARCWAQRTRPKLSPHDAALSQALQTRLYKRKRVGLPLQLPQQLPWAGHVKISPQSVL